MASKDDHITILFIHSCPDMPIFKILQDIDLTDPLWSILKPAIPVAVIGKPVLSGTGSKDFIP